MNSHNHQHWKLFLQMELQISTVPKELIPVSHGQLEARLDHPDDTPIAKAVICHPHPQHGGTMHTKIVYHIAKALSDLGVVVLRFNYRGVGRSTGDFGHGAGERDDARSAVGWIEQEHSDLPLILGGFSFGSMVALSLVDELEDARSAIGVGLPLELYEFSYLNEINVPTLIVQGGNDEFGSREQLLKCFQQENTTLTIRFIEDADHFLSEKHDELRNHIQSFFSTGKESTRFESEFR